MHWPRSGRAPLALALGMLVAPSALRAQTIDDALMMPRRQLCTGFIYAHDSWDRYWEGALERSNGNIGTLTTQSVGWMATYGVTDRLNVIAMLPWVATDASAGTLRGMHGRAGPHRRAEVERAAGRRSPAVAGWRRSSWRPRARPLSDYTPDFLPLSIGLASRRASGARDPPLPGERRLVRRGHGRLHVARHREARPRLLLHERAALLQRPGRDAGRERLHAARRLLEARPVRARLVHAADHQGWRRHPAAGHAVRVEPDERHAPRRCSSSTTRCSSRRLGLRLGGTYTLSGRNVGQSTTLLAGVTYIFKL